MMADIKKQIMSNRSQSNYKLLDDARSMDFSKDIVMNPHMRTTVENTNDDDTGTISRRNRDRDYKD